MRETILHHRLRDLGAVFDERNGWQVAARLSEIDVECHAVRSAIGIADRGDRASRQQPEVDAVNFCEDRELERGDEGSQRNERQQSPPRGEHENQRANKKPHGQDECNGGKDRRRRDPGFEQEDDEERPAGIHRQGQGGRRQGSLEPV